MLCASCNKENRDNARFCAGCGQPLMERLLRQLDLCIVMDATGSMQDYIDATRKDLKAFVQKLHAHDIRPELSYALVLYRDHSPQKNSFLTKIYNFSRNLDDLQTALDGTRAKGGGGDGAEAVADGLYLATHDLHWRENSHKVIVLVGDAPPHGWGGPKDRFPNGCPCEEEYGTVVDIAKNAYIRGISIFSLGIGNNALMKKSFEAIAKNGGGKYISILNADMLLNEVLDILSDEFDKVRIDSIVQVSYTTGSTPQSIASTTNLTIGDVDESMNRLRQRKLI
jgi:von Willebrand factor type A domain/zinc-ribbon domain